MPTNPAAFQRLRTLNDAFAIREGDMQQLVRFLGPIHRAQMRRVFAIQSRGELYPWQKLNPEYAVRKAREYPGKKILVRKGTMKDAFTKASNSDYRQFYRKPVASFGASSVIAGYHYRGNPPLPRRDMITKSNKQLRELQFGIEEWWKTKRVPQILRVAIRLGHVR